MAVASAVVGNCTNGGSSSAQELDADIAGPGVIIGFILSNFLTLISATTTLWLRRRPDRTILRLPSAEWEPILTNFVRALSDQQLITGLLLLIIGLAKYYESSVKHGHNNLWTAGDIVVFSSVTHAITLITLRPYFRIHRRLASFRVIIMWLTYALWLFVASRILSPDKPSGSTKLNWRLRDFWRAATYVEIFCIAYMYLITIFPIFISKEATNTRELIAKASHTEDEVLDIERWAVHLPRLQLTGSFLTHHHSPYARVKSIIKWMAQKFCRQYIVLAADVNAHRRYARLRLELWVVFAECLWPWFTVIVLVFLFWLFGFGTMIVNLHQNKMLSSWTFGQLLPPVFLLLPLYDVISDFSEKRLGNGENATSDHGAPFQRRDEEL